MRRAGKIGSTWVGEKYIHGPRLVDPNKCSAFRTLKPDKKGRRKVMCKLKTTGKWVQQSTLTPR